MDLDSFEKSFRAFKARVEPMLKEWEESKGAENAEAKAKLDAEIHAPLVPKDKEAKPKTGPTLEQWIKAGHKASDYPPSGYESQNTPEEIAAAIAAEKTAA